MRGGASGTGDARLVGKLRGYLLSAERDEIPERLEVDGATVLSALVALFPEARERQLASGIPADAIEAGLRDVRRKHDLYGADAVLGWLIGVMRGDVVQLGRLQVDRRAEAHGHPLHIPEDGPLDPRAVDASLERIRRFLHADDFSCSSWLLDARLAAALPGSNIAAFSRRFDIVLDDDPHEGNGDIAVAKFVFQRTPAEVLAVDGPPPRTALERIVQDRLRNGPPWTQPLGVLR